VGIVGTSLTLNHSTIHPIDSIFMVGFFLKPNTDCSLKHHKLVNLSNENAECFLGGNNPLRLVAAQNNHVRGQ
jgi:hypothetical protein